MERRSIERESRGDHGQRSADHIFEQLCSASRLDRSAAAAELTDLLEEKHSTEHHRRVGKLIASPEQNERTGGLAAIGALLLIDGEDLGPRLSTYAAPLRTALLRLVDASSADALLRQLCDYYGKLVHRCRDPDVLEAEVRSALDALADEAESVREMVGSRSAEVTEARLLVAVLTLRQLTVHAPTSVFPHVATALEALWKALVYPTVRVRFAGTDALYALLVLVAPRANRFLQQWHRQLLAGASVAFDRDVGNISSLHGGMLALSCLLRVALPDYVLREVRMKPPKKGSPPAHTRACRRNSHSRSILLLCSEPPSCPASIFSNPRGARLAACVLLSSVLSQTAACSVRRIR